MASYHSQTPGFFTLRQSTLRDEDIILESLQLSSHYKGGRGRGDGDTVVATFSSALPLLATRVVRKVTLKTSADSKIFTKAVFSFVIFFQHFVKYKVDISLNGQRETRKR